MSRLLWAIIFMYCFLFASSSPQTQLLASSRVVVRRAFQFFLNYQPEWQFIQCMMSTWTSNTKATSEMENKREVKALFRTLVRLKSRLEYLKKRRPQAAIATAALEEALHLYAAASVTLLAEEAAAEVAEAYASKSAEMTQMIRQSQQGWLDWFQNLLVSPFGICAREYFWTRMTSWTKV